VTAPVVVRCRGCGVLNSGDRTACVSCGTGLPAAPAGVAAVGGAAALAQGHQPAGPAPAPATPPSFEERRAAELKTARAGGVARVFLASLGLAVVLFVARKAGAPEVLVEVGGTAVLALLALLCTVAARAEIGPLLARTGGWRGPVTAAVGLGLVVILGAIYFPIFRWLGFPTVSASGPFLAAGWSRWSIYLLLSVAPGLFEELTFRGYLMARLDTLLTPWETLLVQAALFALLHLGVVIFPSHFLIGLVLGIVRRRTGSLYPGMGVHMGWNAICVWSELAGRQFP